MAEVGFAVLVGATILVIVLATRTVLDRRREADRRLAGAAGESSVGIGQNSLPAAPQPGSRTRFDVWFETAVRQSSLQASPIGVIAVMMLLATALGGGLFLWKGQLSLAALGVVVGFAVPLAVVANSHRRYRRQLQNQLPDAFRMIAGSVRAGQTLEQAVAFYGQRGVKPLADEFSYCAGLMQLGMGPAAALKSTAARVRLLDFDLLVSTVGLYTQTGGNLILLLERLADSVRDRNQFRGQFAASTAQSRIVAIAIGSAAPLLLLVYALVEPEHVQAFFRSSSGWMLLVGCAVLEIIGVIWLWRLLKFDSCPAGRGRREGRYTATRRPRLRAIQNFTNHHGYLLRPCFPLWGRCRDDRDGRVGMVRDRLRRDGGHLPDSNYDRDAPTGDAGDS